MQPVAGFNYQRLTQGAGSTIVSAIPTTFHNMLVTAGTLAGTAIFHDVATVAGTTAANRLFTFSQATTTGSLPVNLTFDWQLRNGLVAITSGTVYFAVSTK